MVEKWQKCLHQQGKNAPREDPLPVVSPALRLLTARVYTVGVPPGHGFPYSGELSGRIRQ